MKCTGKKLRASAAALAGMLLLSSCGTKTYDLEQPYDVYGTKIHYTNTADADYELTAAEFMDYFASSLCVGEDLELGTENTDSQVAEAAGVFHVDSGAVTFSKNIYEKLYPASTTKILTAYLALKYGTLSDIVTVSANAANQAADSSVCYIREGDQLSLEELLYGLLLKSGNDAAVAIAEHISGNVEAFAELMNKEAAALGATKSHFVNPHGLQDEEHYTSVYDLYLLFQAALQYEEFEKIIHTASHTASYTDVNGYPVTQEWETTDKFLNGGALVPEGITVIGGKTGTTSDAGYCLVLYSQNTEGEAVISIVMKADSRDNLYLLMTQLLEK